MGRALTLIIAFARPKDFAYVGEFSSGVIFDKSTGWETDPRDTLADPAIMDGLKV